MGIKKELTKFLFRILPKEDRLRKASEFITWIDIDLPISQQQETINVLTLNLLKLIREGRIGLWLLIYQHLFRFFTSRRRRSKIPP